MENSLRVLVIDDDESLVAAVAEFLQLRGLKVRASRDGRDALNLIHQEKDPYDIVLTDLILPSAGGVEVLRAAKDRFAGTEVVILTGFATLETAIDAVRQGAFDYLTKPFKFVEIELIIGKIRERRRLLEENRQLQERVQSLYARLDLLKDNRSKHDKFMAETAQQLERQSLKLEQCLELVRKMSLQTEAISAARLPLHQ